MEGCGRAFSSSFASASACSFTTAGRKSVRCASRARQPCTSRSRPLAQPKSNARALRRRHRQFLSRVRPNWRCSRTCATRRWPRRGCPTTTRGSGSTRRSTPTQDIVTLRWSRPDPVAGVRTVGEAMDERVSRRAETRTPAARQVTQQTNSLKRTINSVHGTALRRRPPAGEAAAQPVQQVAAHTTSPGRQ